MTFFLIKLVHILAATVLFGTGIGSTFYMFAANRRGEIAGIAFAARHVVIADWIFTTPAVIVQLITGVLLVIEAGHEFSDSWIVLALFLYFFAGACWLPVVRIQIIMRDMAQAALHDGTALPRRYWRLERWWTVLGCLAFPAIVAVFWLMVFKPEFNWI